ncbi:MAG: NUDIX hydrolase [Vicinamibacterales bacterium]
MSSVVAARPASTVIVLRDRQPRFEVLLLRRHDNVAFMAGAYVFPGGRVDDADRIDRGSSDRPLKKFQFPDLSNEEELTYRRAAVRELHEEASVQIDPASLVAFAHWVTPDIEIRRYDTRFFLARMPDGQLARHDDHETTALAWLTPDEAIEAGLAGRIMLPPPTWTTFRQLQPFSSIDALLEWAITRPIVRVQPGFIKSETLTMLTLPGDPLFPTIPGWDVPEETRFVLTEVNQWQPQSPPPKL